MAGLIHCVLWLGHHSVVHVGHFANVGEFCEVAEVSALLGDGYGKVRADFGLGRSASVAALGLTARGRERFSLQIAGATRKSVFNSHSSGPRVSSRSV